MKTSRYTEPQILAILRQAEGGMPVAELCRAWHEQRVLLQMAFEVWRDALSVNASHSPAG